jgi:hypothetical protein
MSIRINVASRMVGDRDNIEQAAQFFMRINMGNEGFQRLRNGPWQWRPVDMAAGDRELIEAGERGVLALPKAGDRTSSGEKGKYLTGRDLSHGHLARCATKRPQDASFRTKAHAHCLFMGDIASDDFGKLHDSPPRSNAATSRRPARSTLA